MTKFIIAAGLATALAAFSGTAHADMGIPNLPALPLTTQTVAGVATEAMPSFVGTPRPVITERFAQTVPTGAMPTFVPPSGDGSNGIAYAQIGRVQSTAPKAFADKALSVKTAG